MYLVVPYWIDWAVPALIYVLAVWKGSPPERIIGAYCGALEGFNNLLVPHRVGQMPYLELAEAFIFLLLIVAISMRYDRWWLLVAAAASLLGVATRAAGFFVPLHGWAAGTAQWTWAWVSLAALATGTWRSGEWSSARPTLASNDTRAVVPGRGTKSGKPPAPPVDPDAGFARPGRRSAA